MQCWKTYNRWTDQRRVFVEAVVMSTHQVDGHYEVMLLVSLPLLRLLATFDWRRLRLRLHLPFLSCRRLLGRFLRCFCLSTLLASNWSLLARLSLLVHVATSICRLIAGLKREHILVTRQSRRKTRGTIYRFIFSKRDIIILKLGQWQLKPTSSWCAR